MRLNDAEDPREAARSVAVVLELLLIPAARRDTNYYIKAFDCCPEVASLVAETGGVWRKRFLGDTMSLFCASLPLNSYKKLPEKTFSYFMIQFCFISLSLPARQGRRAWRRRELNRTLTHPVAAGTRVS